MTEATIYLLAKTFEKPEYAEQFLDGAFFMNTVQYFVDLEDDGSGRGDRHEATEGYFQPDQTELMLNGVVIPSGDLAGPIIIQSNRHMTKNVLCLHACYVGGTAPTEYESAAAFEQQLRIPEENSSLGAVAVVVTNVRELFSRIEAACRERQLSARHGLVKYYDPEMFHGNIAEHMAAFHKRAEFSHQREYRLVIDRQTPKPAAFMFRVGDLRDIAYTTTIEAINKGIRIQAKDGLSA